MAILNYVFERARRELVDSCDFEPTENDVQQYRLAALVANFTEVAAKPLTAESVATLRFLYEEIGDAVGNLKA